MIRGIRDFLMFGIAGSALALFAGAVPSTVLGVHPALAANANANDNAGDHGNNATPAAGGDAIGLANANTHANDNPGGGPPTSLPAGGKPQALGVHPTSGGKAQGAGVGPVNVNAEAGALNAVRANLQAFIHANLKSEVGLIAAYAKALVQVEDDIAALDTAEATFDASLASFKTSYPAYRLHDRHAPRSL
jgi:hypothetical protein